MISIPYGAIKSSNQVPEPVTLKKFQFLMVRLKVCIKKIRYEYRKNFNSLWCD